MGLKFYNIDARYINYLSQFEPLLFQNKQAHQINERKYIGVVLNINGWDYCAPLSSFKPKHVGMKESLDFIKIGNYSVINLNNMFPVDMKYCHYVDFNLETDKKYQQLLLAEYRIIVRKQNDIIKKANNLYKHKIINGTNTALSKRCNDFKLLERKASLYV